MNTEDLIKMAKQFIEEADAVLITAGAGMAVEVDYTQPRQ